MEHEEENDRAVDMDSYEGSSSSDEEEATERCPSRVDQLRQMTGSRRKVTMTPAPMWYPQSILVLGGNGAMRHLAHSEGIFAIKNTPIALA